MLFIFVFLKLGIAHAISHELDHLDVVDCEQCVLIVDSNKNQSLDRISPSYSGELEKKEIETKPIILLYEGPAIQPTFQAYWFNKPPPSSI